MDPISHAIIGLSIYGLNNVPDIGNPALIGTIIGAVAPDFDIVTKVKSDYVYLKHHRVESHSLPGIIGLALLITLFLSLFYTTFMFKEVFIWSFIGALSHVLFDLLNSYGVALLYPFSKKKYSLSLITIYDPLVLILGGYILFYSGRTLHEKFIIGFTLFSYLLLKQTNKKIIAKKLKQYYDSQCKDTKINSISVMPSDYSILKWDYIVSTKKEYIAGEIKGYNGYPTSFKRFAKVSNPLMEKIHNEELGSYFKDFTPIYHVEFEQKTDGFIVKMIDLRYKIKNRFKHHAMFYYNNNAKLIKSVFHPFSMENQIEINKNK
ncbi:metal-dependent hydrolase [Proteinivorax hydrogeniformans]|uniref:Metal-dependent hydrolase n=1 Tax=Proteinivorax hydrogeniformans TaxID=1826727 RepID=A0AAU8HRT6_9FIRM